MPLGWRGPFPQLVDTLATIGYEGVELQVRDPREFRASELRAIVEGAGLRVSLFNYAILRWDYAIPMDAPVKRGFWTWSLWPSF